MEQLPDYSPRNMDLLIALFLICIGVVIGFFWRTIFNLFF